MNDRIGSIRDTTWNLELAALHGVGQIQHFVQRHKLLDLDIQSQFLFSP